MANSDDTDTAFDDQRTQIPGRASVHDKTSDSGPATQYQCPFCEYSAGIDEHGDRGAERMVRTHITQETRGKHADRNAFQEHIYVQKRDEEGNHVEDVETGDAATEFSGDASVDVLPDAVDPDTIAADILLTALTNPSANTKNIARKVYDTDEPTASETEYTRSVIRDHWRPADTLGDDPDDDDEPTRQADKTSFSALTDKRKDAIDAIIVNPDTVTDYTLGDAYDFSPGTVKNVRDDHPDIIDHRRAKLDSMGTDTARVDRISDIDHDDLTEDVEADDIDTEKGTHGQAEAESFADLNDTRQAIVDAIILNEDEHNTHIIDHYNEFSSFSFYNAKDDNADIIEQRRETLANEPDAAVVDPITEPDEMETDDEVEEKDTSPPDEPEEVDPDDAAVETIEIRPEDEYEDILDRMGEIANVATVSTETVETNETDNYLDEIEPGSGDATPGVEPGEMVVQSEAVEALVALTTMLDEYTAEQLDAGGDVATYARGQRSVINKVEQCLDVLLDDAEFDADDPAHLATFVTNTSR